MAYESEPTKRTHFAAFVILVCILLVGAACGGSGDATPDEDSGATTVTQGSPNDESSTDTGGAADDSNDASGLKGGTATLTIDGVTYAFDSFICGFGYENTADDEMYFAAAGEGNDDGTGIQVAVQLYDTGLREGFKEVQLLRQAESGDFDVAWALSDTEPLAVEDATGRAMVTLEGDDLAIDGGSYERIESGAETGVEAQGTLQGVCSPDSLR